MCDMIRPRMMPMFLSARMIAAAVLAACLLLMPLTAAAKTVKDFEALPVAAQSEYVVSFLEKMTYDIRQDNPKLAQDIKDYFVRKQPGKAFSEGIEKVEVELAVVDSLAKEGKADLSKIHVESIIVYVVKKKFPPQQK